jgi:hypothetical protein
MSGLDNREWRERRDEVTAVTEASSPDPPDGFASRAEWLAALGYVSAPDPPEHDTETREGRRAAQHEAELLNWRGWTEHT